MSLLPTKQQLREKFVGNSLESLDTPAFVIDRHVFTNNCERMHKRVDRWGILFRAHVKSHKTEEGTRLQLQTAITQTKAVVVSTLEEARGIAQSGLVRDKVVQDILYGLPVGVNKISKLSSIWNTIEKDGAIIRLLVDHPEQIAALENFSKQSNNERKWSVFVKLDGGQKRAGVVPGSSVFKEIVETLGASAYVTLYGFYCHAGDSYGSTSEEQASTFLNGEIRLVNEAAEIALKILPGSRNDPLVLSVGSTPTAHGATDAALRQIEGRLLGRLELHAGNYPLLDLQQVHTGVVGLRDVAQRVLATVISYYPGRGRNGEDEALCDVGAIAVSKDTGPSGGFGDVVGEGEGWRLIRVSQEHGILAKIKSNAPTLRIGQQIEIIGQHACLIAAAYPWYYVVDSSLKESSDTVVDIWIPWKGW